MSSQEPQDVDPNTLRFGKHIRSLRKARGLTQEALAKRSQLAADTIRRLEHGSFSPTLTTVRKLSGGLGIQLSTLFESMSAGDGRNVDLETLIGLLRAKPELPVGAILAMVLEMLRSDELASAD